MPPICAEKTLSARRWCACDSGAESGGSAADTDDSDCGATGDRRNDDDDHDDRHQHYTSKSDRLQGFFRRSIQQKIQYRPCTKNQQCNILRINRNRCQYCRLRKCISVGMSRDGEQSKIIERLLLFSNRYRFLHDRYCRYWE